MMSATTLTPEAISYVCTIVRQRSAIELDAAKAYLIEARLSPVARRCGLTSTAELIGKLQSKIDPIVQQQVVEAMTTK